MKRQQVSAGRLSRQLEFFFPHSCLQLSFDAWTWYLKLKSLCTVSVSIGDPKADLWLTPRSLNRLGNMSCRGITMPKDKQIGTGDENESARASKMIRENEQSALSNLRKQAEKLLEGELSTLEAISRLSLEDIARLVHELQVHKIELEMQNDELCPCSSAPGRTEAEVRGPI